jgi:ribosomal protein S18 acetylase RimI-like enzyme
MTKTFVRPAARDDLQKLLEIDAGSFPAGLAYDREELAYFMNRAGAETLVLESGGEVAAFLIVEVSRARDAATLVTLDVREEFRRRGFASLLLERSEAVLAQQHVGRYTLQVDVDNPAAIAFYLKHGFRTLRRLSRYYPNGADAWLMVKTLPRNAGPYPP